MKRRNLIVTLTLSALFCTLIIIGSFIFWKNSNPPTTRPIANKQIKTIIIVPLEDFFGGSIGCSSIWVCSVLIFCSGRFMMKD